MRKFDASLRLLFSWLCTTLSISEERPICFNRYQSSVSVMRALADSTHLSPATTYPQSPASPRTYPPLIASLYLFESHALPTDAESLSFRRRDLPAWWKTPQRWPPRAA